jgi:hypothetical protein
VRIVRGISRRACAWVDIVTRPRPDDVTVRTIARLERMTSSRMGNPRFRVFFTDGTSAPTAPDVMWSYGAENREYRAGPIEVHTNGRGHITYCKAVTSVTTGPRAPIGRIHWSTVTDNHPTPRGYASGEADVYAADVDGTRPETITLLGADALRDAHRAVYLVDDGATVRPFYVAGWSPDGATIHLHPMPTADGRIRPDNGRPVDFSSWVLGPRRAYHLKVTAS